MELEPGTPASKTTEPDGDSAVFAVALLDTQYTLRPEFTLVSEEKDCTFWTLAVSVIGAAKPDVEVQSSKYWNLPETPESQPFTFTAPLPQTPQYEQQLL